MADSTSTSLHSPTIDRLLTILKPLLLSTSGAVVFQHSALLLENIRRHSEETQTAYTDLLHDLLILLSQHIPTDTPLQTHLQLLHQHLGNPLSAQELKQLRDILLKIEKQANPQVTCAASDQINPSLDHLANHYGTNRDAINPEPITTTEQTETSPSTTTTTEQPSVEEEEPSHTTVLTPTSMAGEDGSLRVDQVYRRHLDDKRKRIQKIQKTLGKQVNAVIKQSEEFGVLLEVEYEILHHSENITEVQELRQTLLLEVKKMLKGNHSLATKLDKAKNYLKIIESEGQHLNDELARVHILSLTDDLTGLSNRRAFMRRLEDETSRVQRYGSPLSLALIDMDFFKRINDQLGHPAGDEVLRIFSSNILSIFRHHDMVARYGGEEFAILLPNTDIDGAHRALEKVKARTAKSHFQNQDITIPMPTFSAGVALYRPGETPGDLIERADKALFRAKDMGRNRIEIAPTDNNKEQDLGLKTKD